MFALFCLLPHNLETEALQSCASFFVSPSHYELVYLTESSMDKQYAFVIQRELLVPYSHELINTSNRFCHDVLHSLPHTINIIHHIVKYSLQKIIRHKVTMFCWLTWIKSVILFTNLFLCFISIFAIQAIFIELRTPRTFLLDLFCLVHFWTNFLSIISCAFCLAT